MYVCADKVVKYLESKFSGPLNYIDAIKLGVNSLKETINIDRPTNITISMTIDEKSNIIDENCFDIYYLRKKNTDELPILTLSSVKSLESLEDMKWIRRDELI